MLHKLDNLLTSQTVNAVTPDDPRQRSLVVEAPSVHAAPAVRRPPLLGCELLQSANRFWCLLFSGRCWHLLHQSPVLSSPQQDCRPGNSPTSSCSQPTSVERVFLCRKNEFSRLQLSNWKLCSSAGRHPSPLLCNWTPAHTFLAEAAKPSLVTNSVS